MGGTCSTHKRVENACKILLENLKERDNFRDIGMNGRAVLRLILKE
jgi:hypothetical protein